PSRHPARCAFGASIASAATERMNSSWPTATLATIHLPSASLRVNSAVPSSMKAMPCQCPAPPSAAAGMPDRLRSATLALPAARLLVQQDLVVARRGPDMHAQQVERLGALACPQQLDDILVLGQRILDRAVLGGNAGTQGLNLHFELLMREREEAVAG